MKKWIFACLLGLSSLQAADTLLEAKGAFFYPQSSHFRSIYSEGPMFGAEATVRTWRRLYTWASAGVFVKSGRSLGLHDQTRIAFYPFGAGIKYLYPVKFMEFYAGAGALGAYMHIHDHGIGIQKKTCRWGGGGIVKAGMLLNYTKNCFFDVFTDYSFLYVPVKHHSAYETQTANLSGWSVGLGIGFRFGCKPKRAADYEKSSALTPPSDAGIEQGF